MPQKQDECLDIKRLLTKDEIKYIVSFIIPQRGIPLDTAASVVKSEKKKLTRQLKTQKVYPKQIHEIRKMVESQYMSSKVTPGESVGVIGAQGIGEKQTQSTLNSVDWAENLLYIKNGSIVIEPFGQMIDNVLKENIDEVKHIEENRTEFLNISDKWYVPSCDENGIAGWHRIEAVTKHLPIGKLVKVTTSSGRTVTATQAKSFLVWNGEKFANTLGSDVKVGDIMPTTSNLMRHENTIQEYFEMNSIFPKEKYLYTDEIIKARSHRFCGKKEWIERNGKEFTVPYNRPDTCFGRRNDYFLTCSPGLIYIHTSSAFVSHIPSKIHLNNDFGFFVGLYLAEGWCTKTFVGISNNDDYIRNRITNFCDMYGITYHLVTSNGKNVRKGISNDLKIHSTLLARFFKKVCDTGSANKKIPEFVYTAPDNFIKGLIDGYYSGDGTINKKDGSVVVSSASEYLITGVSFLLSYYGIHGHLSNWKTDKNNIGSKNIKRTYSLRISNGYAQIFAKNFNMSEKNKQERLQTITLTKKYMYIKDRLQKQFPDRDIYFDKVVSVEYIDGTTDYVYDITVETTRNFQLWNGLNCRDTFHHAGQGDKTVTTGVPRVEELLNATKDPKAINCIVYMKDKHSSIADIRKTIGHEVVELTFDKITKSYDIVINKEPEKWYESFKIIHGDNFTKYTDCVSLKLNMDLLYEYKLNMESISEIISTNYSDMVCVFSPDNIGQMDIFVDTSNIDLPENRMVFIDSDNAVEVYLEEVVQPILSKIIICGIPGVNDIYFQDNPNKFETAGSNFQTILGLPFVDSSQTISNNVWDIYNTLGIEAARMFLIEEFMSLMEGINRCHIQLLVEKMTHSGSIASISRYTMRNEDSGPFSRASFEESMDNFVKAGMYGQEESTRGVSASIICGKRANIGTGICDLKMDVKALPNAVRVLHDVQEHEEFEKKTMDMNEFNRVMSKQAEKIEPKPAPKKVQKRLMKKIEKPDSDSDEEVVVKKKKDKKPKKKDEECVEQMGYLDM